jgi:FkbM family methyltransferase
MNKSADAGQDVAMWIPPRAIMEAPILMRLIPSVLRRYAIWFKKRFSVEKRMGALFLIDQHNLIDRHLLVRGGWDARQVDRLFELAERFFPRDAGPRQFYDIGAHGGLYAILFAKNARIDDRITLVECDPVNLAQLQGNLFVNGLVDRVKVHPFAASDASATLRLNIAPDINRGVSRVDGGGPIHFKGTCEVQARPMDELWDGFTAPIIAKIDVEGHEDKVLAGMGRMLATCKAMLQIEIFPEKLDVMQKNLTAMGFRLLGSINDDHYFTNSETGDGERGAN